jgi:quercetin dioxygenase-like cupin family protein
MNDPVVKIGCVANIFSRMMHFQKAGDLEKGHAHCFDHLTLLAKGKLRVTVDEQTTEFTAPNMIYIKKDKYHVLEAITDDTVAYCVHALRDKNNEEILDPDMIPKGISAIQIAGQLTHPL